MGNCDNYPSLFMGNCDNYPSLQFMGNCDNYQRLFMGNCDDYGRLLLRHSGMVCLPQLISSVVWLKDAFFRLSMLPTTVLALVAALLHQTTAAFLLLWQGDRVVECGLETAAETRMETVLHLKSAN